MVQNSSDWGGDPDLSSEGIRISGNYGDVIGVGVSGSGNMIGKNIVVGSGAIKVSEHELAKIPVPEYAEALKSFIGSLNQQLKGKSMPEEQVKEINKDVEELAEEVRDVKEPNQPIGELKKSDIKSKLFRIAKNVLKVLPKTAETVALFTPLAPFSKLIGEGTNYLVEAIEKEM
jgi:hypothetical protein